MNTLRMSHDEAISFCDKLNWKTKSISKKVSLEKNSRISPIKNMGRLNLLRLSEAKERDGDDDDDDDMDELDTFNASLVRSDTLHMSLGGGGGGGISRNSSGSGSSTGSLFAETLGLQLGRTTSMDGGTMARGLKDMELMRQVILSLSLSLSPACEGVHVSP